MLNVDSVNHSLSPERLSSQDFRVSSFPFLYSGYFELSKLSSIFLPTTRSADELISYFTEKVDERALKVLVCVKKNGIILSIRPLEKSGLRTLWII